MYAAEVAKACRMRAGHERVFTPEGYVGWAGAEVEASWMALPYASEADRVIHLVREPSACIASLAASGVFTGPGPFHDFAARWAPECFEHHEDPVDRAQAFWLDWNTRIEPFCDERVQIEGADIAALLNRAQVSAVPTDTNHSDKPRPEVELWPETLALAARYGYGQA